MDRRKLTRSTLVKHLERRFPTLLAIDVRIAVDEIVDAIAGSVINGRRVEIRGFGVFTLRKRQPRICRNPKTGKIVPIGVRYSAHFKAATKLRMKIMEQPVAEQACLRRVRPQQGLMGLPRPLTQGQDPTSAI